MASIFCITSNHSVAYFNSPDEINGFGMRARASFFSSFSTSRPLFNYSNAKMQGEDGWKGAVGIRLVCMIRHKINNKLACHNMRKLWAQTCGPPLNTKHWSSWSERLSCGALHRAGPSISPAVLIRDKIKPGSTNWAILKRTAFAQKKDHGLFSINYWKLVCMSTQAFVCTPKLITKTGILRQLLQGLVT